MNTLHMKMVLVTRLTIKSYIAKIQKFAWISGADRCPIFCKKIFHGCWPNSFCQSLNPKFCSLAIVLNSSLNQLLRIPPFHPMEQSQLSVFNCAITITNLAKSYKDVEISSPVYMASEKDIKIEFSFCSSIVCCRCYLESAADYWRAKYKFGFYVLFWGHIKWTSYQKIFTISESSRFKLIGINRLDTLA